VVETGVVGFMVLKTSPAWTRVVGAKGDEALSDPQREIAFGIFILPSIAGF
jgi:hypothetical protein